MEVERLGDGAFVAIMGARRQPVPLRARRRRVHLSWRGRTYRLDEEAEAARRRASAATGRPGGAHAGQGDRGEGGARARRWRKGDELLVVEAMKMENALARPARRRGEDRWPRRSATW